MEKKKAVWKGWALKNIHTKNLASIYTPGGPDLYATKEIAKTESTPHEKPVKVEVREI